MIAIRNLIESRRADKDDESGFTLIELLIVVVVLGTLAAIVVFAVQNLTGESAKAACKSDGKTVETGLEAQRAQDPTDDAANMGYETEIDTLAPAYIKSVPTSDKYKINLGTRKAAGTPLVLADNPTTPGGRDSFNVGTVLVSTDAAGTVWQDLNPGGGLSPCNDIV